MQRPQRRSAPRRAAASGRGVVLALMGLAMVAAFAAPPPSGARPTAAHQALPAHDVVAHLPLSFEPAADGAFVSRGPGYAFSLDPTRAVLAVAGGRFALRPAGPSAAAPPLVGRQPLPGTVNHLEGDDASAWTTGVPTFGSVVAPSVWPGVDMVWHGDERALEHDVVVAPGADPAVVALDVQAAGPVRLDAGGDLLVDLGTGTARLTRPVAYQDVAGARRSVPAAFTLDGASRIGFSVGPYDHRAPLVIDPTLTTSTLLGGNGSDVAYAVAVDTSGNTYVTGSTESSDFPLGAPLQQGLVPAASGPSTDVFVSKIAPDGTTLLWSTYLGGKGRDTGYAIAVGGNGSVYVAGVTESPDFPRARAAQDTYGGGPSDAFVARMTGNGSTLEWSTFVGGGQTDRARGLAVDTAGNAYVAGSTSSVDFPTVNPQQPGPYRPDDLDAFLTKIPAAGAPFAYSTRLGGSGDDRGLAVAVDGQGEAFVTGDTLSPGFPTVRPLQASSGGSASGVAGSFPDAFVAKFASNGSSLVYSTFLGGSDNDQGTGIAVDGSGAVYVTGNTSSPNFPTVTPIQPRKDNDADAFVTKIDPAGANLVYSTYLGGGGADGGNGIAVDGAGDAYVTGTTGSTNWATVKPVQPAKNGSDDAFVVKLNAAGTGELFSTYLGGRDSDAGMSVAVDGQGGLHVVGLTSSSDFPEVKPLQGARPPAAGDAFVATLSLSDATTPAARAQGPAAASSESSHDRRVKLLGGLTLALLAAAIAQTVYLRRRTPAPAPAGTSGRDRPGAQPSGAKAGAGLRVLDDAGIGLGPSKASTEAKAGAGAGAGGRPGGGGSGSGSRSNRSPKARGGPKGSGASARPGNRPNTPARAKQGPGAKPPAPAAAAGAAKVNAPTAVGAGARDTPTEDEAGEPTMAVPASPAPVKPRIQEPAIAQLLEEDLWAPEPPAEDEADVDVDRETGAAPAPVPPPGPPPPPAHDPQLDSGAVPVVSDAPAAPLPPVPAEELSFWDLFPEDLPPVRPAAYPAEDLLTEHLALPDGPESVAARHAPEPVVPDAVDTTPTPPPPSRPGAPPEAEIVIAELLDGPVPTGVRPPQTGDAPWPPSADGDDFRIDNLLASRGAPPPNPAPAPAKAPPDQGRNGGEPGGSAPPDQPQAGGRTPEEQARIAADQARRRRARRGGGRRG